MQVSQLEWRGRKYQRFRKESQGTNQGFENRYVGAYATWWNHSMEINRYATW